MAQLYRIAAAAVAWFALGLQYYLMVNGQTGPEIVWRTINFFSFYTILSNIMAALALTLPLVAPNSKLGQFFARPAVRTGVTAYIIVVCVTYHLILRHVWDPQGWQLVADTILHYVTPALFVIDWLFFVPKGDVPMKSPVIWLWFPSLFAVYSLVRGTLVGWYPYPFLDANALGYEKVFLNIGGLIVGFLAVGFILYVLDKMLKRLGAQTTH